MENDINRRLHTLLGRCWHEFEEKSFEEWHVMVCRKCKFETQGLDAQFPICWNPNYCADPTLVISAMKERADFSGFIEQVGLYVGQWLMDVDLILDKKGKLAKLALDWLTAQKEAQDE